MSPDHHHDHLSHDTAVMSGSGPHKFVDSCQGVSHGKNANATESFTCSQPSTKGFDVNIAKKTVCFMASVNEDLVQLVIDTWPFYHSSTISSTDELLTLVEEIAKIPEKKEELKAKLHQYQAQQKEAVRGKDKIDSHVPNVPFKDIQANSECTRTSAEMLKSVVSSGNAVKNQSPKATLAELTRRNKELKLRKMCRACKVVELATSGITFLPCGHFITCEKCSDNYEDCPCCGKNIMGTVRTYLS